MQALTYQVFLTRNSEYHVQSHVCVGVRDRRTGRWFEQHPALFRPLSTTVSTAGQLALLQAPQLGESLEFDLGDKGDKDRKPLRTSPVMNIEDRPRSGGPQALQDLPFPRSPSSTPTRSSKPPRAPRRMRWARWAAAARRRAGFVSSQNTP